MLVTSALSARKSGEIVDLADDAQSEEAPKKEAAALEKHSACGSWSGRYYWRRAAGCQFCKGNRAFPLESVKV